METRQKECRVVTKIEVVCGAVIRRYLMHYLVYSCLVMMIAAHTMTVVPWTRADLSSGS